MQSSRCKTHNAFPPLEVRPARRARRSLLASLEARRPKASATLPSRRPLTGPRGGFLRTGFTLIEMLIVSSLISIVALAIYATLSNGINIWMKANRPLPEEDLNIFFDKFSLDLRNAFRFTGIDFTGTIEKVEFSTLVNSRRLQKKTVGKLIYEYKSQNRILNRYQLDFSGVYSDETDAGPQQSLEKVRALKFRYYRYDKQKNEYLWQDEWLLEQDELKKEGLPLAVRVELEFDNGTEIKKIIKTVSIPAGG